MNILIIGNGGREHALAWKIKQSPLVNKIFCIPGNPGTAAIAENYNLKTEDFDSLIKFAMEKEVKLTVVGPEVPLVNGIVDVFQSAGLPIFGPSKFAAQLEGSKTFSKNLMQSNDILTAAYATFSDEDQAKNYLKSIQKYPVVLKADGLAAGKGVLICQDREQAISALKGIMTDKTFGNAGDKVVIEEFLDGDEVSIFALCDGKDYCILPPSQDHKKIGEGDTGPNTGGMGAYAPAPIADDQLIHTTRKKVIEPVLKAMENLGHPYKGLLYVGVIVVDGRPFVLEFNCRFGDPETQAVLPLLKSDLVPLLQACTNGSLAGMVPDIYNKCSLDVVISSGGYPSSYEKGLRISGTEKLSPDILIFHAGTIEKEGSIYTNGGRVMNLVSLGDTFKECKENIYSEIEKITFSNKYYRKDIGYKVFK